MPPTTKPAKGSDAGSLKDRIRAKAQAASIESAETHLIAGLGMEIEFRPMPAGVRSRLLNTGFTTTRVQNEHGKFVDASAVNYEEYFPQVIAACAHDPETGTRIWGDTAEDRAAIGELPTSVHDELAKYAMRVSGLTKDAQVTLGNASSTTPTDAASSDSLAS